MSQATMGIPVRGNSLLALAADYPVQRKELPSTCPRSFTLCPHSAALAPLPIANACGATTTDFLNLNGRKVTNFTHRKCNSYEKISSVREIFTYTLPTLEG
jgi:hypothetical protein